MTDNGRRHSPQELNEIARQWWDTPVIERGEDGYDADIRAINAMMSKIEIFPEWALQVRDAMPRWGFEMCAHRWLDGLDNVLRMMGCEDYCPSPAGHCGDIPGRVVAAVEQRAAAVQGWIDGRPPSDDLARRVADWLGVRTPQKTEAAQCFVGMVRGCFFELTDEEQVALAERWKARAQDNEFLGELFAPYGFDDLLQNACGYLLIDRLDLNIRLIGGDHARADDRIGNCMGQLRLMWRYDAARYENTRGYLWGLYAYLGGHDAAWLRSHKPDCAGAAIYALQAASRAGGPTPLRRWLAASMLKATEIWCRRAMQRSPKDAVPGWASDLPDVRETIAA